MDRLGELARYCEAELAGSQRGPSGPVGSPQAQVLGAVHPQQTPGALVTFTFVSRNPTIAAQHKPRCPAANAVCFWCFLEVRAWTSSTAVLPRTDVLSRFSSTRCCSRHLDLFAAVTRAELEHVRQGLVTHLKHTPSKSKARPTKKKSVRSFLPKKALSNHNSSTSSSSSFETPSKKATERRQVVVQDGASSASQKEGDRNTSSR